jgi:hypothetical protein
MINAPSSALPVVDQILENLELGLLKAIEMPKI